MDNLTHSLLGLAAAKSGLEKFSPGVMAISLLAANAPDADVAVLLFADRWSFLHYHRHITHSIFGTFVIALLLPLLFWLGDRLIAKWRGRPLKVRLKGLVVVSLLVSATHPFLDWTNNYGVRLLLPWSSKWFYGDFVFIVDPFIWLMLGSAVFLLTAKGRLHLAFWSLVAIILTYLVLSASADRGLAHARLLQGFWIVAMLALVVAHRFGAAQRWGRKIGWAAFTVLVLYWTGLAVLHSFALKEVRFTAAAIASEHGESVTDVAAMPTLANPIRWLGVAETNRAAYRFDLSLADEGRYPASIGRFERADTMTSPFVLTAANDRRTKIFLGFARFPVYRVAGADCLSETIVQLADLRYTQPGSTRGTFALEVPVSCPTD